MLPPIARLSSLSTGAGLTLLLFMLTACTSQAPSPAPTIAVQVVTATPPPESYAHTELRILGMGQDVLGTLADTYTQQHPDLKITFLPTTDYPHRQIPELAKSNTPPDLVVSYDSLVPYMVNNDLLMDLLEYMPADPSFNPNDIQEALLQAGRAASRANTRCPWPRMAWCSSTTAICSARPA